MQLTQRSLHEPVANEKFIMLYITSLIENDTTMKEFEINVTSIIDDLFRKCELFHSENTENTYHQIIDLGKKMIHANYININRNDRRIYVLNSIISNILKKNDPMFITSMLDELDNNIVNKFSLIYNYIVFSHKLKSYHFKYSVMRDIVRRIIDSQTRELKYSNKKCLQLIESTMNELKFSLGTECDTLFNGDYPIPKSVLLNPEDNIFDAMDLITQLTIVGCTDSVEILLEETQKIKNLEFIENLAIVALRYDNKYCYYVLKQKIENIKINNSNQFNATLFNTDQYNINKFNANQIFETPYTVGSCTHTFDAPVNLSNDETDAPYVRVEEVMYNDNYRNHFDVNLLCVSYRVYYKSENCCDVIPCMIV